MPRPWRLDGKTARWRQHWRRPYTDHIRDTGVEELFSRQAYIDGDSKDYITKFAIVLFRILQFP